MRVLVATDGIGGLDALAAGQALAAGWAEAGHQVAVVPLAAGGEALERALAALTVGGQHPVGRGVASLEGLPGALADPPAGGRIVVDLTTDPTGPGSTGHGPTGPGPTGPTGPGSADLHPTGPGPTGPGPTGPGPTDSGEALLAALPGAPAALRAALADVDLVGVVRPGEAGRTLLGLRGAVAERAFADGLDTGDRLAAEAAAAGWLARHGLTDGPGAGAAGAAGAVVLALGGRLRDGIALCAELAGLERTLAAADLVVTGCTDFHIGNRGGQVVGFVAAAAAAALTPCLVFAEVCEVGRREMRTFGVEAAHPIDAGAPAEALRATAVRIGGGWSGGAGGA
jgi:glycerate kinase